MDKFTEQHRHTQDNLTSQLKKLAVGMEKTFGEVGKDLKTLIQEVTKIKQQNETLEKKVQGLQEQSQLTKEQGKLFTEEVTNIVDNQGQWHAYFDEKMTGLGRDNVDLNYRLSQIEGWVNSQIFAQQQQISQGPPQQYPQNWYGQGEGDLPNYGEMPNNEEYPHPPPRGELG